MPDISMCTRSDCPIRDECYRYNAYPDTHQSYFKPERVGKDCEYFIKS
jgi:hypothetical protein